MRSAMLFKCWARDYTESYISNLHTVSIVCSMATPKPCDLFLNRMTFSFVRCNWTITTHVVLLFTRWTEFQGEDFSTGHRETRANGSEHSKNAGYSRTRTVKNHWAQGIPWYDFNQSKALLFYQSGFVGVAQSFHTVR